MPCECMSPAACSSSRSFSRLGSLGTLGSLELLGWDTYIFLTAGSVSLLPAAGHHVARLRLFGRGNEAELLGPGGVGSQGGGIDHFGRVWC